MLFFEVPLTAQDLTDALILVWKKILQVAIYCVISSMTRYWCMQAHGGAYTVSCQGEIPKLGSVFDFGVIF